MDNQAACLECGEVLKGRIDKKFCNESCRNHYHNRLNFNQGKLIRQINSGLRRNRKILSELMGSGRRTIPRNWLIRRGFDFDLITTMHQKRSGTPCYFCYEYGYIPLDENRIQVVQAKENEYLWV